MLNIKRFFRYQYYRLFKGFNPRDTWNLDRSLARWLVPRLEYFRANIHSYPPTLAPEIWDGILNEMIDGFREIGRDDGEDPDMDKANLALDHLREYYFHLWD